MKKVDKKPMYIGAVVVASLALIAVLAIAFSLGQYSASTAGAGNEGDTKGIFSIFTRGELTSGRGSTTGGGSGRSSGGTTTGSTSTGGSGRSSGGTTTGSTTTTGGGTSGRTSGSTGGTTAGGSGGGGGFADESTYKNWTGENLGSIVLPPANAANITPCPTHDARMWHSLYDAERNCYYDHEHHLNPHDVDHIFGEDVYSWFGAASPDGSNPGYAELSYPWQTFSGASYDYETPPSPGSGLFENNLKHTGYKWMYADNDQDCTTVSSNDPCIPSWRVIQHAVFAEAGAYTAMHSMFLEAQAENGGMLRTGGWIDFGTLQAPLNGYRIPLPGDHPYYDTVAVQTEERPYRGACLGPNSMGLPDASLSGCNASWNSEGVLTKVVPSVSGYRIHRGFGMHVRDSMELHIPVGYVDQGKSYVQTDTTNLWHHCTNSSSRFNASGTNDYDCRYNASEQIPFRIWTQMPEGLDNSSLDLNKASGLITYYGYTTRYGDIVTDGSCGTWNGTGQPSNIGLDCVPLVIENWPAEGSERRASWQGGAGNPEDVFEFDIAPAGQSWISYPN